MARGSTASWAMRARRDGPGRAFGAELTAAEVRYLMRHEFAETADDVLWRRSKLGLRVGAEAETALTRFMESVRRPRRDG